MSSGGTRGLCITWALGSKRIDPLCDSMNTPLDLLVANISGPHVLDALWSAYKETGNLDYPLRVLSVLDWDDGVRSRIRSWLAHLPEGYCDTPECVAFQVRFVRWTMPIDCTNKRIDGPVDLDLHVALLAKSGALKFSELPVTLTKVETLRLAMKSAAIWSLMSFATEDSAVAKLCQTEAAKSGGAARLLLAHAGRSE